MRKKLIILSVLVLLISISGAFSLSDSELPLCFSGNRLDEYCNREGEDACRDILEKCEGYLSDIQKQYEQDIERTEEEKQSLQNQIWTLEGRINQLDQQIQQSEVRIRQLGFEINDTQQSIREMNSRIKNYQDRLGHILVAINREEKKSVLEILMMEEDLSGFFNDLTSLRILSGESQDVLNEVRDLRNSLESQEERLAREREEAQREAEMQALRMQESASAKQQQEYLYGLTEEEYQRQMKQKQFIEEQVQEIMSRRVRLVGVADEEQPSLEEAIEIVKWVEAQTGVRGGFVLSIIMQESALGRNVGQCYITDTTSGHSRNIRTNQLYRRGIHPNRDLDPFLNIVSRLGNRIALETPISCYIPMCYSLSTGHVTTNVGMNNNGDVNCPGGYGSFGWGGAMGPAQFIPSTWESIRTNLRGKLGREPNPWAIEDSFLASGTYLANLGGAYGTGESNAAGRYYGTSNIGYESAVMQRTRCLQTYIDNNTMSANCAGYITPFLD